jgi:hypothetical protein
MGDRAQVQFLFNTEEQYREVWFYTHNEGWRLPYTITNAIRRGKSRWNDDEYLARIIFSEMIQKDVMAEYGFAIGVYRHADLQYPVIIVDCVRQAVSFDDGKTWKKFEEV